MKRSMFPENWQHTARLGAVDEIQDSFYGFGAWAPLDAPDVMPAGSTFSGTYTINPPRIAFREA